MKLILSFLFILFVVVSCEKSDMISSAEVTGSYSGTFSRNSTDTSMVTLHFNENQYSGESEMPNYPAIGAGTFEIDGNHINFNDMNSWTADFDWTLILSGNYNINVSGNSIRIWRTNGAVTDEYRLTKLTR